jgi:hypothetical protein
LDKGNEEALEISSRMRTAEEEVTRLGFELQSVRNANARMTHGLEFQIAQNRQLVRGKEGLEEEVQVGFQSQSHVAAVTGWTVDDTSVVTHHRVCDAMPCE